MITFGADFTGQLSVLSVGDATPIAASATAQVVPTVLSSDYTDPSCSIVPAPLTCFEAHFHSGGVSGYTAYGSWPQ